MGFSLTGIILAGGENSRMKTHKALITVGGIRIIDRQTAALSEVFDEVVVIGGPSDVFSGPGVRSAPDDPALRHVRGPMTGVYTGIREAGGDIFVVACDMPFINPGLISHLSSLAYGHDLVIPVVGGFAEPLFGVYGTAAMAAIEDELTRGGRKIQDIFGSLDVRYVGEDELRCHDPGLYSFVNVNTPAELLSARRLAREIRYTDRRGVLK